VNQKVALAFLGQLGYRADVAGDGLVALEALARRSYDTILMDCQLPLLDGFETTKEIRRREGEGRHTPIVAMSASGLDSDRDRCISVAMDDHLPKPIYPDALAAVLHRWVGEGEGV